jgi:hypothetical protein
MVGEAPVPRAVSVLPQHCGEEQAALQELQEPLEVLVRPERFSFVPEQAAGVSAHPAEGRRLLC